MSVATLSSTVFAISPTLATLSSTPATLLSIPSTSSLISLTFSSTVCASFKICAVAIRASSCVSLSSLFNASSISVLPINLLRYFSETNSVKR